MLAPVTIDPPRLTLQNVQILRQAARTSQATFLSSVLPAQGYELDFDRRRPQTSSNWSTTTGRVGHTRGPSNHGSADDPGAATSSDAADQDATTIWGSLQRLQGQSIGLGSAAEHQLGRALELCRDLRCRKVNMLWLLYVTMD